MDLEIAKRSGKAVNDIELSAFLRKYSPRTKKTVLKQIVDRDINNIEPKVLEMMFAGVSTQSVTNVCEYDVLIDDISDKDLFEIANCYDMERLGIVNDHLVVPPTGIFYGPALRCFIMMTVQADKARSGGKLGPIITIPMLYDSAAVSTYLRRDTLDVLYENESPPRNTGVVKICNSPGFMVNVSHGSFENVDLLGQNFFQIMGGSINLNFATCTFEVTFN